MKQMKKINILLLLYFFFAFSSCGTFKDGFQNKKKDNSDEFLVEKKSPLVMPPDYNELPIPKNNKTSVETDDTDVKDLIFDENNGTNVDVDSDIEINLEKSLLEQIKNQ